MIFHTLARWRYWSRHSNVLSGLIRAHLSNLSGFRNKFGDAGPLNPQIPSRREWGCFNRAPMDGVWRRQVTTRFSGKNIRKISSRFWTKNAAGSRRKTFKPERPDSLLNSEIPSSSMTYSNPVPFRVIST
jgi:hypothetical protein